jgi:hypothetical protein
LSLINDALKRARLSALQQEAEANGAQYRAVPAHSRRDSRSMMQLAGWVVAAVAIAAVLLMALRESPTAVGGTPAGGGERAGTGTAVPGPERVPARRATSGSAAAPAPEPEAEDPTGTEPATVAESALPVEPGTEPAGPPPAAEATAAAAAGPRQAPPPRPRVPAASSASSGAGAEPVADGASRGVVAPSTSLPEPAPPRVDPTPAPGRTGGDRLVDGGVYRRRVTASDGSSVELGGIAYSEDRPIAVINGTVVSPGDMIRGFVVLAIEPERVWLEVDGLRIHLALR